MKKMLKLFAAKKAFDWYRGRKHSPRPRSLSRPDRRREAATAASTAGSASWP